MDFTELFCDIDDFCQIFVPLWQQRLLASGERQRQRSGRLSTSEIMTIIIAFHCSGYRTFKAYYFMLCAKHKHDFPNLLSYSRFVRCMPSVLAPLCGFLTLNFGTCTGINYIDSTALAVCGNKRIDRHQVFDEYAQRGKTSMGWFYGFKLHIVVNECGELLAVKVTAGNVDDRTPVPEMVKNLTGKLFGDKGYISQELFTKLWDQGLQLVTPIRRNMHNRLVPLIDKILSRKRSVIETINDQLKNISQIDHTRHRSVANFAVNLVAGLISYQRQEKKPHLNFTITEEAAVRELLLADDAETCQIPALLC